MKKLPALALLVVFACCLAIAPAARVSALVAMTESKMVSEALSVSFKGADNSSQELSATADGRYVAFATAATNLVSNDTNSSSDIFLDDTQTNTVTRISTSSSGTQASAGSAWPAIADNGRYIAFESTATNLVAGDTNNLRDIFRKDTQTGTTTLVSTDSSGTQTTNNSYSPSVSADGRYVVFVSDATNLVAGDTNNLRDIFRKDTQTGTTIRVSTDSSGAESSGGISSVPTMSSDGRHVYFESAATNLVAGDTNGAYDIFHKDTQTDVTTRISVTSLGAESVGGNNFRPSVSSDGRYVSFYSVASNFVAGDTNTFRDVFIKDTQTAAVTRLSTDSSGTESNGQSYFPKISADGRYVSFESGASNLVAGDTNGLFDVFRKDTQTGTTIRVSTNSSGTQVSGGNAANSPTSQSLDISSDGRYVMFNSLSSGLHTDDTNNFYDIFRKDAQTNATLLISTNGGQTVSDLKANNDSESVQSISNDGRYVTFSSTASNLVTGDTNGLEDVFVRDMQTGTTTRVNTDSSGAQGNSGAFYVYISGDGRYVAFSSYSTNLVAGDTNGFSDVFVKDRQTGTTTRVNTDSSGTQANAESNNAKVYISADGRYVGFNSSATNLVAGDTNNEWDHFLKDTQTGSIIRINTDSSGVQANNEYFGITSAISADNKFVAFESDATNLVAGDTNNCVDVFVKNIQSGTTTRVSTSSAGAEANSCNSGRGVSISADGRYVGFTTCADNLVPGFGAGCGVYRKDTQTGAIVVASTNSLGQDANGYAVLDQYSIGASNVMSDDGRYMVFNSPATNLTSDDTDSIWDIFVKDLVTGDISVLSDSPGDSFVPNISPDGRYISFFTPDTPLLENDTNNFFDILLRANPFAIFTNDDNFESTSLDAGDTTASVLSNDLKNNSSLDPDDYILTITNDGGLSGASINPDGTIQVPSGAAAGIYTLTYQVCEVAAPTSCETGTAVLGVGTSSLANTGRTYATILISGLLLIAVATLFAMRQMKINSMAYAIHVVNDNFNKFSKFSSKYRKGR
ncbi:MAG: hypothetical protein M3Q36_00460 [bacterium]|nr:hypothetical protein [bacterium]